MEKTFWLNKWKTKDIGFHQSEASPYLVKHFSELKLQKNAHVLVPLCGKTKDMLWLASQGYQVIGIELSAIACQEFFAEMNVIPVMTVDENVTQYQYDNITLLCGDLFAITSADLPAIQAIYDCKAMVALPEEMRKQYVQHLKSCCGKDFKVFLLAYDSKDDAKGPPFAVEINEIELLYGSHFQVKKILSDLIKEIPERLKQKGYHTLSETLYFISSQ